MMMHLVPKAIADLPLQENMLKIMVKRPALSDDEVKVLLFLASIRANLR